MKKPSGAATPSARTQEAIPVTTKTLHKAKAIFHRGDVARTGPTRYAVLSTSGETYHVHTEPARVPLG